MDIKENTDTKKSIEHTYVLGPKDEALLKFGENTFINSLDTLRDFAKTMITIITGLFATYFAILKFLGIDNIQADKADLLHNLIGLPPIFFILSILSFVITIIPVTGKVSIESLQSVEKFRNTLFNFKIGSSACGISLFIIGLTLMLAVNLILLN